MIISTGGEERVCLLDLEETVVPGTMRATGDWVNVQGGQLQYLGRRDRLIKRHGKRVNLDSVQQVRSPLLLCPACCTQTELYSLSHSTAANTGDM